MIERVTVVIDDEFISTWKGKSYPLGNADLGGTKITIRNFVPKDKNNTIQVNLANRMNAAAKNTEAHEKQHVHNSAVNIIKWANSINEVALMGFLNEVSAHLAGELSDKEPNSTNVFEALMKSMSDAATEIYMNKLYPSIIDKFLIKKPNSFMSIEVRKDVIKKAMACYFDIIAKGQVLDNLDKSQIIRFQTAYMKIKDKLNMLSQNKRADYFRSHQGSSIDY